MIVIWFRHPDWQEVAHVRCESVTLARAIWEKMEAAGFEMVSAQP